MKSAGADSYRPARRTAQGLSSATGLLFVALVVMVIWPDSAMACPVCYGDAKTPMTDGVNNGILVLLGFVGVVQVGFVALFWSFWRRIRSREHAVLEAGGGSH